MVVAVSIKRTSYSRLICVAAATATTTPLGFLGLSQKWAFFFSQARLFSRDYGLPHSHLFAGVLVLWIPVLVFGFPSGGSFPSMAIVLENNNYLALVPRVALLA